MCVNLTVVPVIPLSPPTELWRTTMYTKTTLCVVGVQSRSLVDQRVHNKYNA